MSLLKQIDDKGAVLEWSPIQSLPNLVALGTKDSAGSGFDDYGGELEIHKLDFSNAKSSSSTLLGKARANSRFASIAWSSMASNTAEFPSGLIAGGMVDGCVHVWDTGKLLTDDPEPLIASVEQHQGAIHGLQFNPHKESSHLLASGGSDCEVYVMSLERPEQPNVFVPAPPPNNAKHTADITKVAWNTQVVHILASAAQNGSTYIWDLRQKKAWCELRDPSGGTIADVAWNPDQGLHLVTASGDDRNPVLKLWDLRSSTSLPLATLQGHTEGILSVSWCPNDPSLLLSCGKDNKTMMWDLLNLQPVYDLPMSGGATSQGDASDGNGIFGNLASSAGQRRYHVSWSPCMPAVASACSFDRRVQFYSMHGAKSRLGRAPKWLRKPCGATFAFGGKLTSFDSRTFDGQSEGKKAAPGSTTVSISQVVEDRSVVDACDAFHNAISTGDFKGYCQGKSRSAESERDRQVWGLMKVICFEENARGELLSHLGFDSAAIAAAAEDFVLAKQQENGTGKSGSPSKPDQGSAMAGSIAPAGASAADVFGVDLPPPAPPSPKPSTPAGSSPLHAAKTAAAAAMMSPETSAVTAELIATALAGEKSEPMIRKALVVGNFSVAVDCCLEAGLMAEALLLAQCGDQALWQKTQSAFFERQNRKYPFLTILYAIIRNEMMDLVLKSDLSKWKETLALLSTYGKSDEFPSMCEALAGRLETERRDLESATLCYMCAANVPRVVAFWTAELKQANASLGRHTDTKALQRYVEKVVIFTQANPVNDLGTDCSTYFAEYASLLASQGRLDLAPRYLKGAHVRETILMDRLYHAGSKPPGMKPPAFPFEKILVNATRAITRTGVAGVGGVAASSSGAGASGGAGGGGALPAGWVQQYDANSRRSYFVNQATGVSQWEPPVMPKPQQPQMQQTTLPTQGQPVGGGGFGAMRGVGPSQNQGTTVLSMPRGGGFPPQSHQPTPHAGHPHSSMMSQPSQPSQPMMQTSPQGYGSMPMGQPQAAGQGLGHPYGQPAGGLQSSPTGGYYPQQQQPQPQMQQQPQQQPYHASPQPQQQQPQFGGPSGANPMSMGQPGGGYGGGSGFGQPQPVATTAIPNQPQPYGQQQQQQSMSAGGMGGMPGSAGAYGGHPGGMGGPVAGFEPGQRPSSSMGPSMGSNMSMQPTSQPQPQPQPQPQKPVAATPMIPAGPPPECVQQLGQYIDHLTSICSPPEKRQMQMVSAAYSHLLEKFGANEVSSDVVQKLAHLVMELTQRNFVGASAMQTDLANTAWGQHKEWIKGLKVLIQLASKK